MRLTAQDLREMNILKYYRLVRKWDGVTVHTLLYEQDDDLTWMCLTLRLQRKPFVKGDTEGRQGHEIVNLVDSCVGMNNGVSATTRIVNSLPPQRR